WNRGMLGGSPSTRSLYGWTVGVRPFNTRASVAGNEQPVLLPDALIAWSGEIFNQGVRPDGEVLASVLETPDFEGFHSLDGFWSVVRVTPEGPQIFTDHLGLRPMYYWPEFQDRKSTRLNSSHVKISYAVFCLKKKTPSNVNLYI